MMNLTSTNVNLRGDSGKAADLQREVDRARREARSGERYDLEEEDEYRMSTGRRYDNVYNDPREGGHGTRDDASL